MLKVLDTTSDLILDFIPTTNYPLCLCINIEDTVSHPTVPIMVSPFSRGLQVDDHIVPFDFGRWRVGGDGPRVDWDGGVLRDDT